MADDDSLFRSILFIKNTNTDSEVMKEHHNSNSHCLKNPLHLEEQDSSYKQTIKTQSDPQTCEGNIEDGLNNVQRRRRGDSLIFLPVSADRVV